MTPQLSTSEPQAKGGVDHRLLLDRVHRAGFDDQGREFVARVFAGGVFWDSCTDAEILGLAVVAQQQGLFDQALETLAWLNHERPQCGEGWRARAELLATLGRNPEAMQVAAQAQRFLPAEAVAQWAGSIRDSGPDSAGEADSDRFLEPFARLRRDEEDLRAYLALFRGRDEAFARQWADRDEGKQGYVPVQRPLQAEDLREHLQGRKTYGIYLLTEDSRVWTGVIDVDLVPTLRDQRAAAGEKANIRRESVYLYTRLNELAVAADFLCFLAAQTDAGRHADQVVAVALIHDEAGLAAARRKTAGAGLVDVLRCQAQAQGVVERQRLAAAVDRQPAFDLQEVVCADHRVYFEAAHHAIADGRAEASVALADGALLLSHVVGAEQAAAEEIDAAVGEIRTDFACVEDFVATGDRIAHRLLLNRRRSG